MVKPGVKFLMGACALLCGAAVVAGGGFFAFKFINSASMRGAMVFAGDKTMAPESPHGKTSEERIQEAHDRADHVKGVYMTAAVADDKGRPATKLRNDIVHLIDSTELNAVVIDIKETDGTFLPESLKNFVDELHKKNIWVIARLVAFNDTVAAKAHPEMALKRADNGRLWLDNKGHAWLDPESAQAREYLAGVAKRAVDYGFDEIQFDYIRFPSDGDVKNIVYPVFMPKEQQKYEALRGFFQYINKELKSYKPEIILSADLFGYVAIQKSDLGVGQRMEDLGDSFDYISFMLYPSHYYNGLRLNSDSDRNLPALAYPYRSKNIITVVSNHPYDVVYRSLLIAEDFFAGKNVFDTSTSTPNVSKKTATTTNEAPAQAVSRSHAKLRPWLQDFNLGVDTSRGIYYDTAKVEAQIKAAEDAGASGWMLWNASNVYTDGALKKE